MTRIDVKKIQYYLYSSFFTSVYFNPNSVDMLTGGQSSTEDTVSTLGRDPTKVINNLPLSGGILTSLIVSPYKA